MNLGWNHDRQRKIINDHIFSGYLKKNVTSIYDIPRVPMDIIDEYRLEMKFRAYMHSISVCARWDP